jgi:hypothetical protein
MDFDNFWTEELQETAIPAITGMELDFAFDDDEDPCYELTDGDKVHTFDCSDTIEDVYEFLCQDEDTRKAFEAHYREFYREMQRLNPNGVPRSSYEKHLTTYKDDL